MINLEYSGNTYKMPTKFKEITIDKYIDIISIDQEKTEIEKLIAIISILTGMDEDIIRSINVDQIKMINNHLQFLFKSNEFLLVEQVNIDGVWYGFNKELSDISFGEYIDLEEFSKTDLNKNIHVIMAILYRPIIKKKPTTLKNLIKSYIYRKEDDILFSNYKIEDYVSKKVMLRAELFKKKMSVDVVLGAMFFFSILKIVYINNIKRYLTKKQMMIEVIKYMEASGVSFKPIGDG